MESRLIAIISRQSLLNKDVPSRALPKLMLKIGTQLLKEERWSASLIDFSVLELYLADFLPQSIRSC